MKLSALKAKKWNYPVLAFLIPVVGMLLIMLFSGYEPFGKYSMLYSDMYHQYYPFFVAFRKALLSGDSLLYNWSVGLGMDYLGLISYYLASPLNLLSVLVPEPWLLEFFSLLVPVKLGLASLFFALFLKKTFHRNDVSLTVFGALYGTCAWAMGYHWNLMWLDTFALLPLVALGTFALLKEKKTVLYTVTLFLSVYSNYYIGLFTCIFVLLLFICYQIGNCTGAKQFFKDLLRIALFSLLAIGMTMVLELPTLAALQNTQSSVNKFPSGFRLNIATEHNIRGLFDAMRQVAGNTGGALEPTFKEGLPNLYCGVFSLVLGFLFLQQKNVKLRDKICSVVLLLFFMVSFIVRQLDYIWHGFHFTNMIPYRFSFLFSFVVLCMAYKAWDQRQCFRWYNILIAGILTAGMLLCSDHRGELNYLLYNGIFLGVYLGVMLYGSMTVKPAVEEPAPDAQEPPVPSRKAVKAAEKINQARRRTASEILVAVMALELAANLVCFGIYFPGTGASNYPRGTEHAASMIRYMKEREKNTLFYRAEVDHSQTLNDGALNGYNGISTFTSSANVKVTEFMRRLGFAAKNTYNRYCFEEASPVSNLFLDLKYMLNRDGKDRESSVFQKIHKYGDVTLLANNYYLPLGFLTEPELAELDFGSGSDVFQFQNDLMRAATGLSPDVWYKVPGVCLSIAGQGVDITDFRDTGYCAYENGTSGSEIVYSYTADRPGFFCISLTLSDRNSFSIWKNGVELYSESVSLPQMLAVDDVQMGDEIQIKLKCKNGESGNMTLLGAILDMDRFGACYDILAQSRMELTSFRNTKVEGTVSCDRDGLLYTSIPQNGNWSATVDGLPADITLIGDVMVGLELTEGTHDIVFRYQNPAFRLGLGISLVCLLIFSGTVYFSRKPQQNTRKGKFQK